MTNNDDKKVSPKWKKSQLELIELNINDEIQQTIGSKNLNADDREHMFCWL